MILSENVKYRGKMIAVSDLKPNSHVLVKVQCPECGEKREVAYKLIVRNGHCMCQKCAIKKQQSNPLEVGKKYGKWVVVKEGTKGGYSICECECGTVREVDNYSLQKGISKSCGCRVVKLNKQRRRYLQLGTVYGKLTVISHSPSSGYSICECECGNKCTVSNSRLENGLTKSCGCLQREFASERAKELNAINSKENHWNWKGGISDERTALMSQKVYKDWRTSIFERDKYTCQKCSQVGRNLHAHHIHNYADYPELRLDIDNGVTLCEECHREFHHINGLTTNKEQLDEFLSV